MSLEIERKFLVTSKDYRSESKKIDIEQAYFVANKNGKHDEREISIQNILSTGLAALFQNTNL